MAKNTKFYVIYNRGTGRWLQIKGMSVKWIDDIKEVTYYESITELVWDVVALSGKEKWVSSNIVVQTITFNGLVVTDERA